MDFLVFAFSYAIILLGFVVFAINDVEHDPRDDFHFADSRWGKLPKHKVGEV